MVLEDFPIFLYTLSIQILKWNCVPYTKTIFRDIRAHKMRTYIRPIVRKKNHREYNLLFERRRRYARRFEIYIFANTLRIPFVVFGIIDIELNRCTICATWAPSGFLHRENILL